MTTGIPSMIKDVGTLFDGSKSWQEKLFAAGDLVFNVAMDASMLTGVGEVMAGARIVADIGEHAAVDTIEHAATDTVEHTVTTMVEKG